MLSVIRVCLLEDYFWNNNSFTYPNNVPSEELYHTITDTVPIFISPRTLTCVLQGDYNSAIYRGRYYRLIKLTMMDVEKKIYKYQMEEDIMMNFLKSGGLVKGTIIRTNNKTLLEQNLQNTKSILESPRELIHIRYDVEKVFDWRTGVRIIFPSDDKTFFEQYFAQINLAQLVWNLENNRVIRALKENRLFTLSNQPIYIVSYAEATEIFSWKNIVISKIKEAFALFQDKVITSPDKLPGYWSTFKAISSRNASIGSSEESGFSIQEINLSGLTDIIPIDLATGERWKVGHPVHRVTPSNDKVVSGISDSFVRKLSRVTHLPLKNKAENKEIAGSAYLPSGTKYYNYLDNSEDTGYKGRGPQVIKLKGGHTGYLWYVDYLNFAFIDGSTCFPPGSPYYGRCVPPPYYENYYDEYVFSKNKDKALPEDKIPGLGYLIFELIKNRDVWEGLVTYRGPQLSTIEYRSGFNKELFETYSEYNWKDLPNHGNFWDEKAIRGKPYWAYYRAGAGEHYISALPTINGCPVLSFLTLDVDLLLWLYIAPCYKGGNYNYQYRYLNDWEYRRFLVNYHIRSGYIYYTPRAVTADLGIRIPDYPYNTLTKIINPFHRDRISKWLKDREARLDRVSLKSSIVLPYPINDGDVFTSDLTHKWSDLAPLSVEKGYELENSTGAYITGYVASIAAAGTGVKLALTAAAGPLAPFMLGAGIITAGILAYAHRRRDIVWWKHVIYNDYVLQDLFRANKAQTSHFKNRVVLFIHQGKLKFGTYREYVIKQKLTKDEKTQVVESVESSEERQTTFYHIQQLKNNEIKNFKLSPEQMIAISEEQNRLFGDGVYTNFSEEEIARGPLMVKLEGTPWYAYFSNGKVSLLTEDPTIFKKYQGTYSNLKVPKELTKKSIYSKMNQKASLIIYGNELVLNTKFNLQESDSFPILDKLLNPKETTNPIEFKLIEGGNRNDFISQWFAIPKKGLKSTDDINAQQVSSLQLQLKHENQNYHMEKWLNDLIVREKMRGFNRRREDADFDLAQNIFGTVGNALSLAALTTVPLASAGAASLFQKASTMMRLDPRVNELAGAKHAMFSGKYAGSITSATGSILSGIPGMVKHAWIKSRITEDEIHFIQENAMNMFMRDTRYHQERENKIEHLNQISSSYVKAEITDRDIFDEYTKLKGLGDIYLQILLPSPDQEVEIAHVVENFGAECIIPMNDPILITDGMEPILLQFSRLDNAGVLLTNGVLAAEEREALVQVFEKGVKFVNFTHKKLSYVPFSDLVLSDEPKPSFNTDNIESWSREEWDRFVHLHKESDINELLKKRKYYGLTEEEYEKVKDTIDKYNPFPAVNEVIRLRGSGDIVLHDDDIEVIEREDTIKPFRDEIDGLKEKLRLCEIDKTNILQAKNTCDLINANRIKELEGKLKAGYAVLEGAKKVVEQERDQLKEEVKKIPQLQEEIGKGEKRFKIEKEQMEREHNKRLKIEKEQLEEEHNKKLIQLLDERDKAVAAARRSGFNSRNEEVGKLKDELEKCKKGDEEEITKLKDAITLFKTTIQGYKDRLVEQCEENKKLLSTKYEIDLGVREDGGNNLRDLILEILNGLKYMRLSRLDSSLGRKYKLIQPIIDRLMEFEGVPIVAKWETVKNSKGWDGYLKFLEQGGDHNGDVTAIINMVNEIKSSFEITPVAHSIKAILDELNWLVFLAKEGLKEQLKTDQDLQFMFAHVYPGESSKLYDKLFGDHTIAITKRLYVERNNCVLQADRSTIYLHTDNPYFDKNYSFSTTPRIKEIETKVEETLTEIEKQPDRIGKLDEKYKARNFRPKVELTGKEIYLSDKREDITVFFRPKYLPENFSQAWGDHYVYPVTDVRDWKTCYYIDSMYWSWKYMKVWTSKKTKSGEYGLYLNVSDVRNTNGLNNVHRNRNNAWKNREKYLKHFENVFSTSLKNISLEDYNWERTIQICYWDKNGKTKSYDTKINLLDIFGPFYVVNASILLCILSFNNFSWSSKIYNNYTYLKLNTSPSTPPSMHAHINQIFVEKWTPSSGSIPNLTAFFHFEFNSIVSILNYIWRHVKLELDELENTFDSTFSQLGLNELVKKVGREINNCP